MKQMSAILFVWGVVSVGAVAQASELAIHPLHIESVPSGLTVAALKQAFKKEALKAFPEQASGMEVERYLRQQDGTSCWGNDSCSVALIKTVRAKRLLLVSVVRTEPWIVMSARILDAKGAELRNIPMAAHTPDADMSEGANFEDGFAALFKRLNGPIEPPIEPPLVSPGMSNMRIAAYTTAGVAAVGLAVGVTFTALYSKDYNQVKKLCGSGCSWDSAPEGLTYLKRSRDHRLYAILGYSVGGASLASSLVLFFLSPERKYNTAHLFFVPLEGGGALSMAASF